MALKIDKTFKEDKNIWNINLSGDLDIYTSKDLKKEITLAFEDKNEDIQIDCCDLDYIDSTGLGVLMSIYKEVKEKDKNIYILNAKPNIRKIFEITELDKLFIFRGESNE